MTRLLAIDPGEINAGLVAVEGDLSSPQLPSIFLTKAITAPFSVKDTPFWIEAEYHRTQVGVFVEQVNPDISVLEYPALHGYRQFNIGAMHYACAVNVLFKKKPFIHMASTTWKKVLCNHGFADKVQYKARISELFGITLKNYDVAAALCMALVGWRFYGAAVGALNRECLSSVEREVLFDKKDALFKREGFLWRR